MNASCPQDTALFQVPRAAPAAPPHGRPVRATPGQDPARATTQSGIAPDEPNRLAPEAGGYIPSFDGLRGLAIIMVLLLHFLQHMQVTNKLEQAVVAVSGYGAFGVELFFILSGFLITGILIDGRNQPHYFRNFYMRRALRIFPVYYGTLLVVFVIAPHIAAFRGPQLDYLLDRQAWAWLYGVNIFIGLKGEWSFSYLQHLWSLSIEEHFYFVWPAVVFLLAPRPRALFIVCLTLCLGAMAARFIGALAGLSWWTTYLLTPFRLDALVLGALIAVVLRQEHGLTRLSWALPRVTLTATTLLLLTFAWTRLGSHHDIELILPIRAALVEILLGCLMVFVLTRPAQSATSRFFTTRVMVFFGTYSYGLYVYHHFLSYYFTINHTDVALAKVFGSHGLAITAQATFGIAVSVALAYVSYEFFEKRFLRLKRLFPARVSAASDDAVNRAGAGAQMSSGASAGEPVSTRSASSARPRLETS